MNRHILINLIGLAHSCMHVDALGPFLSPHLAIAAQHRHSLLRNLNPQLQYWPRKKLVSRLLVLVAGERAR